MLSDPLSVTVDGSARSLPRVGALSGPVPKVTARNTYRTADSAYAVSTTQYAHRDGSRRAEIILRKTVLDTDVGTTYEGYYSSGFGLTIEMAPYGLTSAVEIANLRTALLTFVDSTLQGRLITGES